MMAEENVSLKQMVKNSAVGTYFFTIASSILSAINGEFSAFFAQTPAHVRALLHVPAYQRDNNKSRFC